MCVSVTFRPRVCWFYAYPIPGMAGAGGSLWYPIFWASLESFTKQGGSKLSFTVKKSYSSSILGVGIPQGLMCVCWGGGVRRKLVSIKQSHISKRWRKSVAQCYITNGQN